MTPTSPAGSAPGEDALREALAFDWAPNCEWRGRGACRNPDGCHCAEIRAGVIREAQWSAEKAALLASKEAAEREAEGAKAATAGLKTRIAGLEAALKPFAGITPSTLHPDDGCEAEPYSIVLAHPKDKGDFTGADLARARAALSKDTAEGSADV